MKAVFRRSRPQHNVMDMVATPSVDKFSFPSGHTTRAALMSCFLCTHLITDYYYQVCIYLWAVCVAMSRLLLGRHHVLDVLCGLVIGVLCFYSFETLWVSEHISSYFITT